jgi:signal transduction histidine kinase
MTRYLGTGEIRVIGKTFAVEGKRADGSEFPVEISLAESGVDERTITAIIRDLTERDAAERALRELAVTKERQRLLDRMIVTIEAERRSFAADLDNGPVHHLFAVMLQLGALNKDFAGGDPDAARRLEEVEAALREQVDVLHSMMARLVPTVLESHGLGSALQALAKEYERANQMVVTTEFADPPRLPRAAEISLYRIAQEALANAAIHGQASNAALSLKAREGHVFLGITDDGEGFDTAHVLNRVGVEHFGLDVMRERAEMVGGRLSLESTPGAGTTVTASIPMLLGQG